MKWIEGRLTRVQITTRPDNVMPESWGPMSKKPKTEAIREWETEKVRIQNSYELRGLHEVPEAEENTIKP